jgi:hypothetical protein
MRGEMTSETVSELDVRFRVSVRDYHGEFMWSTVI